MTDQKTTATLIAYLPDNATMTYKTNNFSEVFAFKKICTANGIEYAVRFAEKPKANEGYRVKKESFLKKLLSKF